LISNQTLLTTIFCIDNTAYYKLWYYCNIKGVQMTFFPDSSNYSSNKLPPDRASNVFQKHLVQPKRAKRDGLPFPSPSPAQANEGPSVFFISDLLTHVEMMWQRIFLPSQKGRIQLLQLKGRHGSQRRSQITAMSQQNETAIHIWVGTLRKKKLMALLSAQFIKAKI
jgi:hypothetical protein